MLSRIRNLLVFRLERLMMRGPAARFAFILVLLLFVVLSAGLLIRELVPGFESIDDAVWWAFEHVVVPEYVDDDEGLIKRTLATALIVLGSIFFAGAVIAILVQWMEETTERLELGLTPVALDAHIVLLGWTSRTPTMLQEVMVSQGRVERFVRQRGARRLHVALLVERADATLMQEVKDGLGEHWDGRQIILRSGSSLSLDDLKRVDFSHAAAIVVPAADTTAGSAMDADTHTVKTLLTLSKALEEELTEELPLVVAELQDPRYAKTLRAVYGGPMEIVAGDEIVARLMVQTVRYPGLSHVYAEFLSDLRGSQIYVREEPELTGLSAQQLTYAYPEAVVLGFVRPEGEGFRALLNPPDDLRLEPGDRIAVLGSRYKDAVPPEANAAPIDVPKKPTPEAKMPAKRRVLVLGWNRRVMLMLSEFASYPNENFAIDIVSEVSATKRQKRLAAEGPLPEQLEIRQLEFDYTVAAYLDDIDLASYDNIVMLASERLKAGAQSDARTILGYLLLHELMKAGAQAPPVLVELTDVDNISLFENWRGEIIVSPVIVSHMLTRVILRRELRAVFDELFGSSGCEIEFRRVVDYGMASASAKSPGEGSTEVDYTFADLQRAADARGQIAIGIRRAGKERTPNGGVELTPGRDQPLRLDEHDDLIVITTHG